MKIKRHFFILTITLLLIIACVFVGASCTPYTDTGSATDSTVGSGGGEDYDFTIVASNEIYQLGDEAITLSVKGTLPKGYTAENVSFFVDYADETTDCTMVQTNTLEFKGTGRAVIKASIGDLYSNPITIYSVLSKNQMVENFKNAFEGTTYLGLKADVGIHPSTAHLYSIKKNDGFVRINEDGKLEFVGIRAVQTLIKVYFADELLYDGVLNMQGSFTNAILKSLVDNETIPNLYTDVSNDMIKNATSLKLQYIDCSDIHEYDFLSYCQSLKALDLTGSTLFDLSFLQGIETLETLIIDNCYTISNTDNNLTLQKTILSLTSLKFLSICGSFSCFDRTSYEFLISLVMREVFTLRVLNDVVLDQTNASDFSDTVFFSMAEYISHIEANNNKITPHEGFSHAILCINQDKTALSTSDYRQIDASTVSILELYGNNQLYKTYVSSENDLILNLYNYSIDATGKYGCNAVTIYSGVLNINAVRGECHLYGGYGKIYTWWGDDSISPGAGIYAAKCIVNVSSGTHGKLYVYGGKGGNGIDGYSDGSNPDDRTSRKHGSPGEGGACGIFAHEVNFLAGTIYVYGGNGGRGGDGADGSNINIFSGGYNAGHGNAGGVGGNGLNCHTYTIANGCSANLYGGTGGEGGKGGTGYLAGSDGDDYTEVYHGVPYYDHPWA